MEAVAIAAPSPDTRCWQRHAGTPQCAAAHDHSCAAALPRVPPCLSGVWTHERAWRGAARAGGSRTPRARDACLCPSARVVPVATPAVPACCQPLPPSGARAAPPLRAAGAGAAAAAAARARWHRSLPSLRCSARRSLAAARTCPPPPRLRARPWASTSPRTGVLRACPSRRRAARCAGALPRECTVMVP